MNKNLLVVGAVVVLVLVGAVGYVVISRAPATTTAPETSAPASVLTAPPQTVAQVDFDGAKFAPDTLTVKAGTTVKFVNGSSSPMWVASAPHPTHTDYPEFDQKQSGNEYAFIFTRVGTWKYHNHLNPADTGTVIVTE